MAFLIPSFTDPATEATLTNAYARILSVKLNKQQKSAIVQLDIFATQAARTANKMPAARKTVIFSDQLGGPALFTSNFLGAPVAPDTLPATPTSPGDILLSQAYAGLKTHTMTAAILAAATPI